MGIGQSLVAFWLFGSLSRRFHNRGCSLKGSLIICLCCLGKPFKKTFFLGKLSQMWVEGVADSQTRSKPLKKTNHPENRYFWPELHLSFSQIPQKSWGGFTPGIDKSLALERKIESRKRNSLSIFESGKTKFSFYSRFSRVARQNSLSTLDFSLDFWEFKSRVQHHKSVSLREGCKKIHVKSLVFCL